MMDVSQRLRKLRELALASNGVEPVPQVPWEIDSPAASAELALAPPQGGTTQPRVISEVPQKKLSQMSKSRPRRKSGVNSAPRACSTTQTKPRAKKPVRASSIPNVPTQGAPLSGLVEPPSSVASLSTIDSLPAPSSSGQLELITAGETLFPYALAEIQDSVVRWHEPCGQDVPDSSSHRPSTCLRYSSNCLGRLEYWRALKHNDYGTTRNYDVKCLWHPKHDPLWTDRLPWSDGVYRVHFDPHRLSIAVAFKDGGPLEDTWLLPRTRIDLVGKISTLADRAGIPHNVPSQWRCSPLPVISLSSLREGSKKKRCKEDSEENAPSSVMVVADALLRRGFCWLHIDGPLQTQAAETLPIIDEFLTGQGRDSGGWHAMKGHFKAAHKSGLRLLTGDMLNGNSLPMECDCAAQGLAAEMDQAQIDTVRALATEGVWGTISSDDVADAIGSLMEIPQLSALATDQQRYGMLDIVRYLMVPSSTQDRKEMSPREIVSSHIDPGLLILGLPQSESGLELLAEEGWLAPPVGCGVLWAGRAANKQCDTLASKQARIIPARHRVVAKEGSRPRLAAWHELCTSGQLVPPMLANLSRQGLELRHGLVRGTDRVLELLRQSEDGVCDPQLVVGNRYIPLTKSGTMPYDQDYHLENFNGQIAASLSTTAESVLFAKRTNRLSLASGMVQIVPRLPERDAALEYAGLRAHESDFVDWGRTWMVKEAMKMKAGRGLLTTRGMIEFMMGPGWELQAHELILQEGLCSAAFPSSNAKSKGAPPWQFYSMVLTNRRVVVTSWDSKRPSSRAFCDEELSAAVTHGLASAALAESGLGTFRLCMKDGLVHELVALERHSRLVGDWRGLDPPSTRWQDTPHEDFWFWSRQAQQSAKSAKPSAHIARMWVAQFNAFLQRSTSPCRLPPLSRLHGLLSSTRKAKCARDAITSYHTHLRMEEPAAIEACFDETVTEVDVCEISSFLQSHKIQGTVQEFRLELPEGFDVPCQNVFDMISQIGRPLRALVISLPGISANASELQQMLKSFPDSLVACSLNLSFAEVHADAAEHFFQSLPENLQELDLQLRAWELDLKAARALGRKLEHMDALYRCGLDLQGVYLSGEQVESLSQPLKAAHLRGLRLLFEDCGLDMVGMTSLVEAVAINKASFLEELVVNVTGNHVGTAGCEPILLQATVHAASLRELGVTLKYEIVDVAFMVLLGDVVKRCSHVERLQIDLEGCEPGENTRPLLMSLPATLKCLNLGLRRCEVGQAIDALPEMFSSLDDLRVLEVNLAENFLTDAQMQTLSQAISELPGLDTAFCLNISNNAFGLAGAQALRAAIKAFPALQKLHVDFSDDVDHEAALCLAQIKLPESTATTGTRTFHKPRPRKS